MDTIAYITSKAEQYDLKDIVARKTKLDKSELPKHLSNFENDVGFITDAVANLKNYYTKENTYTKEEVQQLVSQKIRIQVVESLPTENISNSTIYFLRREKTNGTTQYQEDVYDEYIYVDGIWELIGNTYVDLTNYYTKEETDNEIKNKIKTEIDNVKQIISENETDIENKLSETNTNLQNEIDRSKLKDSEIEKKIKDNAKAIEDEKKRAESKEEELQNKDIDFQNHIENKENPHSITAEQVGLGNVTNVPTTDAIILNSEKNITSGAVFNALDLKVDKVTGKGLSDQNFTFEEKTKLSNLKNYDDTELKKEVDNNTEAITILNADADTANSVSNKIKTALENINSISFSIVSELPETGQAGVIYFVSDSTTIDETSSYSEYVWLDTKFERLGQKTMNVDLTEFYKKTEVNALLSAKNNKITVVTDTAALTDADTFDETAAGTNPAETKSHTMSNLWEYIRNKVKNEFPDIYVEKSHNIPRLVPKDITDYIIDETFWDRLNGTGGFSLFDDIYVGDFFKMSRPISAYERTGQYQTTGSEYVTIAGLDTMWGNGDQENRVDYHHAVMVPGQGFSGIQHFGRSRMNPTSPTEGGYKSSEMNTTTIGAVASSGSTASTASINQQLYNEFGTHLKTTRELVSISINASGYTRWGSAGGCSSGWEWISAQAILMSEVEVYGSIVWSSSGYDTGNANRQLPLFAFSKQAQNNRSAWYWLKDVASAAFFCSAVHYGSSDCYFANIADSFVRPRFILAA